MESVTAHWRKYWSYFLNVFSHVFMIMHFHAFSVRRSGALEDILAIWTWYNLVKFGYGSIPINTIFRGMNIHLPAILMFTTGTRFWHTAICFNVVQLGSTRWLLRRSSLSDGNLDTTAALCAALAFGTLSDSSASGQRWPAVASSGQQLQNISELQSGK